MSFCPSKDIHSVYLDNELPEPYKSEYELHLKNCVSCQKELALLKGICSQLQSDSKCISPDSYFLDDSFERLQVKMAYSRNVSKASAPKYSAKQLIPVAAAAAAVFALVLPLRLNSGKSVTNENSTVASVVSMNNVNPINTVATSANNVSFNSGRSVLVSGNIQEAALVPEMHRHDRSAFVQNVKNVDMLRPDFGNEAISIRITVPGVDDSPVVTEIKLPKELVSGRF